MNTLQNLLLKELVKKLYKLDIPISGGSGSSEDDAIVINLDNESEAIRLEYSIMNAIGAFLNKKPKLDRQENLSKDLKHYDKLVISMEGDANNSYELYFDISESFGQFAKKNRT